MDEVLRYFRDAIERPESVPPWPKWWREESWRADRVFEPGDFELLRTGRLDAARMILRRAGWPAKPRITAIFGTPCLTEESLAALELPPDYREFLLAYNGGYVTPCWFRAPGEWAIAAFLSWGGTLDDFLPIADVCESFALSPRCETLRLKVRGAGSGGVWLGPSEVAGSFTELLSRLDYPEHARPWMEQIDNGDSAGFRLWVEGGGEFNRRDPASALTPLEYTAVARNYSTLGDSLWVRDDGLPRRKARYDIGKLLVERGAEPGRAFLRAIMHHNFEIARLLLPPTGTSTADLRESRHWLRAGNPELLAVVEQELKTRK
jgi:hypothetical protein